MAVIKQRNKPKELNAPQATITSVIVPMREKNRPPQLSRQEFRNRTITICLYPNIICSIWDLQKFAQHLSKIWRAITNNDIRYQQKHNQLPAFLGTRDICVQFSSSCLRPKDIPFNELCLYDSMPYLRITLDNVQVATFIVASWCKRTGQMPLKYSVVTNVKGKMESEEFDTNKSNPYMFVELLRLKNVTAIQFGAVAELLNYECDRDIDFYNIPGVRCSQKFGTQINGYALKHLRELREWQQRGEIQRAIVMRDKANASAVQYLEEKKRKRQYYYAPISDSYYGRYHYKHETRSAYGGAFSHSGIKANAFRDAEYMTNKTNELLAKEYAPEVLKNVVEGEILIRDHRALQEQLNNEHKRRMLLEEELEELKEEMEQLPQEPHYFRGADPDKTFYSKTHVKKKFTADLELRNDAIREGVPQAETLAKDITEADIAKAVEIITYLSNVEVNKATGQIMLKFK